MGALLSAGGDILGGFSKQGAYGAQAAISHNNQIIQNQNASYAAQSGEIGAENQELRNAATSGAIRAKQGASGVDVNTGSSARVAASADEIGSLDAMTIRSNAAKAAYGYKQEAAQAGEQADIYKSEEASAPYEGFIGAAGSLLSGASSSASKYEAWQNASGEGADMSPSAALAIFG